MGWCSGDRWLQYGFGYLGAQAWVAGEFPGEHLLGNKRRAWRSVLRKLLLPTWVPPKVPLHRSFGARWVPEGGAREKPGQLTLQGVSKHSMCKCSFLALARAVSAGAWPSSPSRRDGFSLPSSQPCPPGHFVIRLPPDLAKRI